MVPAQFSGTAFRPLICDELTISDDRYLLLLDKLSQFGRGGILRSSSREASSLVPAARKSGSL
jgi:hypothetical protein